MRVAANFFNRIKLISPVQPLLQKEIASRFAQIKSISLPSRPQRGVSHSSRTLARDAVDAARCRRTAVLADGEVVWS
jgi:hypothetical protein